jgi:hypothetical protein
MALLLRIYFIYICIYYIRKPRRHRYSSLGASRCLHGLCEFTEPRIIRHRIFFFSFLFFSTRYSNVLGEQKTNCYPLYTKITCWDSIQYNMLSSAYNDGDKNQYGRVCFRKLIETASRDAPNPSININICTKHASLKSWKYFNRPQICSGGVNSLFSVEIIK